MGVLNLVQRFVVAIIAIPTVVFCIKYHSLLTIITTVLSIVGIYELHGISNRIAQLLLPTNYYKSSSSSSSSSNNNDDGNHLDQIATTTTTTTTAAVLSVKSISQHEEIPIPNDPTILTDIHYYFDTFLTLLLTYIGYFHSSHLTLLLACIIFIFFGIFVIDMILFSPFGQSDEHHTRTFIKIFIRTFSVLYIGLGFSSALILVQQHRLLLVVILFDNWASDAMALLFGKKFGRMKLHRYLSPNKTIEGGVGAILGSVLTSIGFWYLNENIFNLHKFFDQPQQHTLGNVHYSRDANSITIYIIYGIILGVLGIVGDLIESYLKRIAKVKDSGSFFGAHGGVLDRVDGLLFSFPFMMIIHLLVL